MKKIHGFNSKANRFAVITVVVFLLAGIVHFVQSLRSCTHNGLPCLETTGIVSGIYPDCAPARELDPKPNSNYGYLCDGGGSITVDGINVSTSFGNSLFFDPDNPYTDTSWINSGDTVTVKYVVDEDWGNATSCKKCGVFAE